MSSPLQPSYSRGTAYPTATTYTVDTATIDVTVYFSATDVLQEASQALYDREREANVILPRLELLSRRERISASPAASGTPDFWLIVRSSPFPVGERPIDFILSCTNGHLGTYPIFIWAARPVTSMDRGFIQTRMTVLSRSLLCTLASPKRVFSIFGKRLSCFTWSMELTLDVQLPLGSLVRSWRLGTL